MGAFNIAFNGPMRINWNKSKSIFWLLGSNAFATVTLAVGAFFVARLAGPGEFGNYALAAQVAVSIYPVLTLRYEQALPLHGSKPGKDLLVLACLYIALTLTALLFLIVFVVELFVDLRNYLPSGLVDLLPMTAIGGLSLALGSLFQSVAITNGDVKLMAMARMIRAISFVGIQCGLVFLLGSSASLLLIGEVSANFICAAVLIVALGLRWWENPKSGIFRFSWRRFAVLAKKYREFPLITLPHNFAFAGLGLLFTTTFGSVYGAVALGQYFLMRKLVFGVLGIFNVAINQNSVSEIAQTPNASLFHVGLRAGALMGFVSLISAIGIMLFGPALFQLSAGDSWKDAGIIAIASVPLIIMEPITSTLAFLPVFLRVQHIAFAVAVVQGAVGVMSLFVSAWAGLSPVQAVLSASISVSVIMAVYVCWLLRIANRRDALQIRGSV